MSLDVTVEKFAPERMRSPIGALAGRSNRPRRLPDESIAAILNRSGKSTGRSNSWIRGRVCALRQHQRIAPYREGERDERGEVTLNEAASALSVSPSTILRMLRNGALPAQQLCMGAPWIIRSQDIKREDVSRSRGPTLAPAAVSRFPREDS
jgi:excisionase family DNA binding protein